MTRLATDFPWTIVVQLDDEVHTHYFARLGDARRFIMAYALDMATEQWDWKMADAENPSPETVNGVLAEMKAYNIFLTLMRTDRLTTNIHGDLDLDVLRKDYRNPDHRSTTINASI